jgi:hypothetical protein
MAKFPSDIPKAKAIRTFEMLGFKLAREREHINMSRDNPDGSRTAVSLPNHRLIKGSTLRTVCLRAGVPREDFLTAYEKA